MPKRTRYAGELPTWRLSENEASRKKKTVAMSKTRMAKMRAVRKPQRRTLSVLDSEREMESQAQMRLHLLNDEFRRLQTKERNWPGVSAHPKSIYTDFYNAIRRQVHNIVCACCACINHEWAAVNLVSPTEERLSLLAVNREEVPYDFRCGIEALDSRNIFIASSGIIIPDDSPDIHLAICGSCNLVLRRNKIPPYAVANYRWVGEVPKVLQDLSWFEEKLIARRHMVGTIIRLQDRHSYRGLKGHMILVPQDTTELLNILPRSPETLPDSIRVVWAGRSEPRLDRLQKEFTINRQKVYDALVWLTENNEDYRDVEIDRAEFERWPPVFVAQNVLDSIARVRNPDEEDATKSGGATEEMDSADIPGDLPLTTSAIIDVNNACQSYEIGLLSDIKSLLSDGVTINVVAGTSPKSHYDDPQYFTSAFPCLFPFGTGKHICDKREARLSLKRWIQLLLRHSSRRFQTHQGFVVLCFDLMRLEHNATKATIQTKRGSWSKTKALLLSLTPDQLTKSAEEARQHKSITDPAVKELLKMVNRVGSAGPGSSEKKWYMYTQLKSSTVYHGSPLIFLTLNPAERDSPIALYYAGEKIDIERFYPEWYSAMVRMQVTIANPLAVIEYFHRTLKTIIETVLEGGLFGELGHHFGTIEYQGKGTPHCHLLLWLKGATSPEELREKAKHHPDFQQRLLDFIATVSTECMPEHVLGADDYIPKSHIFKPLLHPDDPNFEYNMAADVYDIISWRQIHSRRHKPTCFKYGKKKCRMRFPRNLVEYSRIDGETGVVYLKRDHRWLNGYNKWLTIMMHGNHDCQFLLTKSHAIASIHYIIKYISKQETSMHSILTLAAAVRKVMDSSSPSNTEAGKSMILKVSNKVDSNREVGIPEMISHLLDFPDHYTDGKYSNIHTTRLLEHMRKLHNETDSRYESSLDESAKDSEDGNGANIELVNGNLLLLPMFNDYAYRGEILKDYCLYDYHSLFYRHAAKFDGLSFTSQHPLHRTSYQFLRSRTNRTIPALLGKLTSMKPPKADDKQGKEEYYCLLTALFIPWENNVPFKPAELSWEQFFKSQQVSPRLLRFIENINLLHRSQEEARIDRLQQKAEESGYQDDNLDNGFDNHDDDDHYDDDDWIDTQDLNSVEDAFIQSAQNSDPYVLTAIDANLDYGYLQSSTLPSSQTPPSLPDSSDTIYYSSIPAKVLFDSIKHRTPTIDSPFNKLSSECQPEPHVFLTNDADYIKTMEHIVREFSLNKEQRLALCIIAEHTLGYHRIGSQLRMGIFGEGGTGKSRLIEAIRAWFSYIHREKELTVAAMTGAAASNIAGTTIHSALAISPQEAGDRHWTRKISDEKADEWRDRKYLIVDEVSMLSCKVMMQIHSQLCKAKGDDDGMFGGVNVLFFGDFLQLPVVSNYNIYTRPRSWEHGHDLWRSLNVVVILRQQMRQAEDPRYADLLRRVRLHQTTPDDIKLLQTRIGAPLPDDVSLPIIVRRNHLRQAINNWKLRAASEKTGQPITYCIADIIERSGISVRDAQRLIKAGNKDALGDGILALVPAAPLMITKNINQNLGIVNGAMVQFYGFANTDGIDISGKVTSPPAYMLVKVNDKLNISIPGLPPSVVPIAPISFTYKEGDKSARLSQFPVTLAYAITDFKCQGQTFNWILCDLEKPRNGKSPATSAYVQLSRVRSFQNLFIMRPFDPDDLSSPLPPELIKELQWQEEMAAKTLQLYSDLI